MIQMLMRMQGLLALVVTLLSLSLLTGCDNLSSQSLLDPQNKEPLADVTNQWVDFEFKGDPGKMTSGKNIRVYTSNGYLLYKGGLMNGQPKGAGVRYAYDLNPDVFLVAAETVDGKREGQCEFYSANYDCLLRTKYRRTMIYGPCEMTAPRKISCTFAYGAPSGDYVERYDDGKPYIKCRYYKGVKQTYVEYYPNGKKRLNLTLKGPLDDQLKFAVLEGKEYYEDGKLSYKGEFINVVQACGILFYIDSCGAGQATESFSADDRMLYHGPGTKYNEQGEKIYEGLWNSGKFSREAP
jgi:antitoxin component YwqK of YwqJK toxin-antitoxin module